MAEISANKSITARYDWVDVLKALGIIAIYIGHYGNAAGRLYPFVFKYHVPLFFFAAGFFSTLKEGETFWAFVRKQVFRLLIPYLCFSALSMVVYAIEYNSSIAGILTMTRQVALGIRNQLFASSLWFIPCLFVMSIFYNVMLRILKKKYYVLGAAFLLFLATQLILPNNPAVSPSWPLNVDSAMYYLIYYAFGAIAFISIKGFLIMNLKPAEKVLLLLLSAIAAAITLVTYLKGAEYLYSFIRFSDLPLIYSFYLVAIALCCIYANILLAFLLRKVTALQKLGKSTLILCGTEQVLKLLLGNLISLFGLKLTINSSMTALLFVLIALAVSYNTIVRFINRFLPWMAGKHLPVPAPVSAVVK